MKLFLKRHCFAPALAVAVMVSLVGCVTPDGEGDSPAGDIAVEGAETKQTEPNTATGEGALEAQTREVPGEEAEAPKKYDDSDQIRVGDMLRISFRGTSSVLLKDHEEQVSEDGSIFMEYIGEVKAAGKSRVALQKEIEKAYVPKYFKNLRVTVAPDQRFFYVYGEVNSPNRHIYTGEITVLGAITVAGDFTEFANERKVKLIRGDGTSQIVNCFDALKDPSKNLEVLPGDTINVPKSIFW